MSESPVPVDSNPQTSFSKLLPWIVLLLSALGLFYFVEKGCGAAATSMEEKKEMPLDTMKKDSMTGDSITPDTIH